MIWRTQRSRRRLEHTYLASPEFTRVLQALECAEALPVGQRYEGQIKALKKKLEAPPPKPAS